MKLQTSQFTLIGSEGCEFRCESSIIMVTLLGEGSTLLHVSRLPCEGFSWNFIPCNFKQCQFDYDR